MTYEAKEYYKLKNDLELKIYRRNDTTGQMLEKLGLRESLEQDESKLAFKHSAINKREINTIQIADSLHSKSVQRSNFLKIDNELIKEIHKNPEKAKLMSKNLLQRKLAPGEIGNNVYQVDNDQIFLMYCKDEDVSRQQ